MLLYQIDHEISQCLLVDQESGRAQIGYDRIAILFDAEQNVLLKHGCPESVKAYHHQFCTRIQNAALNNLFDPGALRIIEFPKPSALPSPSIAEEITSIVNRILEGVSPS